MSSFYTQTELESLGLKSYGENVLISRKASIYSSEKISLGSNVRIDDFCILSGKIEVGDFVHIAPFTNLHGNDTGIYIDSFVNISSKVSIYAVNDDYLGSALTNPMVPDEFRKVHSEKVVIEKHVIIGSGCVVLPGVILREGSAFGALTLINKSSEEWTINVGIPYRKIRNREKKLLILEKKLMEEYNEDN